MTKTSTADAAIKFCTLMCKMPMQESNEAADEDETSAPHQRARSKKWDDAERDKFKRLVKEKKLTQSAMTEPTLRRFARSIGEIGRLTRSVKIGRFPLLNFVLQSLKMVPEQEVRQKTNKARITAAFFARRCFCHLLFRSLHDISALTPNILQKTLTVIVTKKRAKQTTRKKKRRPGRATTTRTKTERTTTTTPCQQQH